MAQRWTPLGFDLSNKRILVIDNSGSNRLVVREILTGWGITVGEAEDPGTAFLQLLQAGAASLPFDLVLIDGQMPDMAGCALASRIKATPELASTPIVMLTSEDRVEAGRQCRDLAIAGYVLKPVRRSELYEAVSKALGPPEHGHAAQEASDGATFRILLCEDSQDNAFLVSAYLKGTKYVLEHVTDGEAGAAAFQSEVFDLVLMDMQMPVLDGHAATRRIRQWEADHCRKPVPILALTAHAQIGEGKRCEASGCTAFLSKPIRKSTLLAAMATHLAGIKRTQDYSGLPSEVQKLVPDYLRRKRSDLDLLWKAVEAADYCTICTFGHQLKGSGAAYGLDRFSEIGCALERAAKTSDLEEARRQTGLLASSVSEALAVISDASKRSSRI
jgi:CheY-like chemotaxis protein